MQKERPRTNGKVAKVRASQQLVGALVFWYCVFITCTMQYSPNRRHLLSPCQFAANLSFTIPIVFRRVTLAKVVTDCISTLQREITHCSEYVVTRSKHVTVVQMSENRVVSEPTALRFCCKPEQRIRIPRLTSWFAWRTNEWTWSRPSAAYGIRRKRLSGVSHKSWVGRMILRY